jgi:hypothetical protein
MKRLRLFALLLLVVVSSVAAAPTASAQAQPEQPTSPAKLPSRRANYAWDKTLLRATFSFRDAIVDDPNVLNKLSSGLPNVITMRAYLYRDGDDRPIALAVRRCDVTYDLWAEVYAIRVTEQGRVRNTAELSVEGVIRQCGEARDLAIADRSQLTAGQAYFIAAIVDVNPISPQLLEQMRKWMSRPRGSAGAGSGDAIFGSFTEVFLRQIGTTDRTVKFRTQNVVP